jgi:hypothetical protein
MELQEFTLTTSRNSPPAGLVPALAEHFLRESAS